MSQIISKPWGQEIIFTEPNLPYTGKILKISAGKRLSLQYHDQKTETLVLISGQAKITHYDKTENMEPNFGYTILANSIHRLEAVTDSQIIETSTPETGTTFRVEDDYSRGNETKTNITNLPHHD